MNRRAGLAAGGCTLAAEPVLAPPHPNKSIRMVVPLPDGYEILFGTNSPLPVTSAKRTELAPDVPTLAKSAPQFPILGWDPIVGPAKVPAAVVARHAKDLNAVFTGPRMS